MQLLSGIPKQHALLLLRGSLSHQLRHLLRQLDPEGIESAWEAIDSSVQAQIGQLASRNRQIEPTIEPGPESTRKVAQTLTTIPIRAGGLGLPSHAATATAIYESTKAFTAQQTCIQLKPPNQPEPPDIPPEAITSPQEVLQQLI